MYGFVWNVDFYLTLNPKPLCGCFCAVKAEAPRFKLEMLEEGLMHQGKVSQNLDESSPTKVTTFCPLPTEDSAATPLPLPFALSSKSNAKEDFGDLSPLYPFRCSLLNSYVFLLWLTSRNCGRIAAYFLKWNIGLMSRTDASMHEAKGKAKSNWFW